MPDTPTPAEPHENPRPDEAATAKIDFGAPSEWPPASPVADTQGDPPWRGAPNGRRHLSRVVVGVVLIGVGVFLGVAISHHFWQPRTSTAAQTLPIAGSGSTGSGGAPAGGDAGSGSDGSSSSGSSSSGSGGSGDVASVAATVDPALVDITVTNGYQSSQGAATGIVLSSSGLVLTNNHVIDGATSISATDVGNGQTYSATVLGYDTSHDIALIQLNGASGLKTAQLGDSSAAEVGQTVVAIGNAGGAGGTPSAAGGSIVALDQQITAGDQGAGSAEQLSGMIETDADIQPGDSGGPLVNTTGQVLGVDTAGGSSGDPFGSSQTRGFAVPINTAMAIVQQIENHDASATVHIGATAFLGVEIQPAGDQGGFGGGFGGQSGSSLSGATVAGVLSGSPADGAGLAAGDVITSVDGQSVDSPTALRALLADHRPGDKVEIAWTDASGSQQTAGVTLASGPAA